nr:vegetative cell wall protein gp1-like [Lolium perenne]
MRSTTGSPTMDVQPRRGVAPVDERRTPEAPREAVPPPQVEGPAGLGRGFDLLGSANAPSSTPPTPATGGLSRPGSVRGASSPLTPASPASSPASSIVPASPTSSPRSSSTPPVSTLQHPPPTVPPPVVQPTIRRSGRYALAEDGAGPTDEDAMQRVMRRKAEKNLDTAGALCGSSQSKIQAAPALEAAYQENCVLSLVA